MVNCGIVIQIKQSRLKYRQLCSTTSSPSPQKEINSMMGKAEFVTRFSSKGADKLGICNRKTSARLALARLDFP